MIVEPVRSSWKRATSETLDSGLHHPLIMLESAKKITASSCHGGSRQDERRVVARFSKKSCSVGENVAGETVCYRELKVKAAAIIRPVFAEPGWGW